MNARKILLWGIPVLIVGLVIACVILGLASQTTRQKGWITYTAGNSGLADDNVRAIAFDDQGRAWIGTERGMSVFDGQAWTTYSSENSDLVDDDIQAIAFDERDRAWIITSHPVRVSIFDGEAWTTHTGHYPAGYTIDGSSLMNGDVHAAAFDEQGRVWIGTWNPGKVSVFDEEAWTVYTPGDVRDIAFDKHGHAWIGTQWDGVSVFDGETWTNYTKVNSGLAGNSVLTIAFDEQDRAWIGTELYGVSVFDRETWTTYTPNNSGLPDGLVIAIAFDEHDHTWISTRNGVSVFNGKDWTTYTTDNSGLIDDYVRAITFDKQGRAWMCTRNGVSVLSPDEAGPATQPLVKFQDYAILIYLSPVLITIPIGIWLTALAAHPRLEAAKKQGKGDWRFLLRWIVANTIGLVVSYLVTCVVFSSLFAMLTTDTSLCLTILIIPGVAGGVTGSVVCGILQWSALRHYISRAARWVSIGAAGFAVGYAVTAVLAGLAFFMVLLPCSIFGGPILIVPSFICGAVTGCVFGAVSGAVAGAGSGIAQQHVLQQQHVSQTEQWRLASIAKLTIDSIASGIGASAAIVIGLALADTDPASALADSGIPIVIGCLSIVAGGVLGGAIAGRALTRLLQTPAETPAPEEDTASPPQNVDSPTDEAVEPLGEEEVE